MDTLGLPLEYEQLAQYFDAHNVNEETEEKNSTIEQLLKARQVKTVLDLTCGTGSQVFFLAERGYEVTGADLSKSLIAIARKKAASKQLNMSFINGDMRSLTVGTFDAVITIFNAIGHLQKSDFESALQNIKNNLKEGGFYLFDIFNLEAMTDEVVASLAMDYTKKIHNDIFHHKQYSEIDRQRGLLTSHDEYVIEKEESSSPMHIKHAFTLQIYTRESLNMILAKNGFEVVGQYDMSGYAYHPKNSLNILTVARSIGK